MLDIRAATTRAIRAMSHTGASSSGSIIYSVPGILPEFVTKLDEAEAVKSSQDDAMVINAMRQYIDVKSGGMPPPSKPYKSDGRQDQIPDWHV